LRGHIEQGEGGEWLIGTLEPLRANILLLHERIRGLEKLLAESRGTGVLRVIPKELGRTERSRCWAKRGERLVFREEVRCLGTRVAPRCLNPRA
jgi:hypothetical protein